MNKRPAERVSQTYLLRLKHPFAVTLVVDLRARPKGREEVGSEPDDGI